MFRFYSAQSVFGNVLFIQLFICKIKIYFCGGMYETMFSNSFILQMFYKKMMDWPAKLDRAGDGNTACLDCSCPLPTDGSSFIGRWPDRVMAALCYMPSPQTYPKIRDASGESCWFLWSSSCQEGPLPKRGKLRFPAFNISLVRRTEFWMWRVFRLSGRDEKCLIETIFKPLHFNKDQFIWKREMVPLRI